jgi:CubicO group peptidase (beta-lactamase class C family)
LPKLSHNPGLIRPQIKQYSGVAMQTVIKGYRGLSLLVWLNWDRVFFFGTLVAGLLAGAFLGTAITHGMAVPDVPSSF